MRFVAMVLVLSACGARTVTPRLICPPPAAPIDWTLRNDEIPEQLLPYWDFPGIGAVQDQFLDGRIQRVAYVARWVRGPAFRELLKQRARSDPQTYCAGAATCPPEIVFLPIKATARESLPVIRHLREHYPVSPWFDPGCFGGCGPVHVEAGYVDVECMRTALRADGVPLEWLYFDTRRTMPTTGDDQSEPFD